MDAKYMRSISDEANEVIAKQGGPTNWKTVFNLLVNNMVFDAEKGHTRYIVDCITVEDSEYDDFAKPFIDNGYSVEKQNGEIIISW